MGADHLLVDGQSRTEQRRHLPRAAAPLPRPLSTLTNPHPSALHAENTSSPAGIVARAMAGGSDPWTSACLGLASRACGKASLNARSPVQQTSRVRFPVRQCTKTARPVSSDAPVSCGIAGHDRPGQEIIAEGFQVDDGSLHWSVSGRCGFATSFAYSSDQS